MDCMTQASSTAEKAERKAEKEAKEAREAKEAKEYVLSNVIQGNALRDPSVRTITRMKPSTPLVLGKEAARPEAKVAPLPPKPKQQLRKPKQQRKSRRLPSKPRRQQQPKPVAKVGRSTYSVSTSRTQIWVDARKEKIALTVITKTSLMTKESRNQEKVAKVEAIKEEPNRSMKANGNSQSA